MTINRSITFSQIYQCHSTI